MIPKSLGTQLLVDFYNCDPNLIGDIKFVREAMLEAALAANATIVTDAFHEFKPQGLSGVVVIAESHIAIHAWPEFKCASIDIFSCGNKMKPELAVDFLKKAFAAKEINIEKIKRGTRLHETYHSINLEGRN